MNRKLPDLMFLGIFMIIIAAPLVSPPLPVPRVWDQDKPLAQDFSPLHLAKNLVEFPAAYSRSFDGSYLLHHEEVRAFQSVCYHILHEKVFPNVLIAKEDWLFYTGENNIDDYECTSPFTDDELETIRERLMGWNTQLQERGIHFYVVIAPNKESVYPQFLPDRIKPRLNACRIDQVINVVTDTPLAVLDLRSPMRAAARNAQVYHRTDTHWNDTGALLAAQMILSRISRDFPDVTIPSINAFRSEMRSFSGDLAAFLPADERFVEREPFLQPLNPSALEIDAGAGNTIIATTPGSTLPTALVFRDSFSNALVTFLSDNFSRIVFAHSFSVDMALVDQENPDVVIYEIAQRYLTVLR